MADLPSEAQSDTARDRAFIVIAAYNEGTAIEEVVRGVVPSYPNVVVVDDGSSDDTGDRACAGGATVLTHLVNRGQGAALQTGLDYALRAGAEYVVTFDADGQHNPDDLPAMLAPLQKGEVHICLGSRFLEHKESVPMKRRVLLRGAVIFTWLTSGVRLTDAHNGLRAMTREAASRIDLRLDRMAHASELVDQVRASGLPYREVPVHIRYTDYSQAKGQAATGAFRVVFDYLVARMLR